MPAHPRPWSPPLRRRRAPGHLLLLVRVGKEMAVLLPVVLLLVPVLVDDQPLRPVLVGRGLKLMVMLFMLMMLLL
jgi:predicted PurR-regulated permease PerM